MNGSGQEQSASRSMQARHPRELSISEFTYDLPVERIATYPLGERDASRLLVHRDGSTTDRVFRELPALLPAGSLLVLNDTRVVCARIHFRRASGAQLECMVLQPAEHRPMESALADAGTSRWWCMMGNAKRWKGEELVLERGGRTLIARRLQQKEGEHLIEFSWDEGVPFVDALAHFGSLPLPPYMRRRAVANDVDRYNTVFATNDGSIAAPTASLHFSETVLRDLAVRNIHTARLTLHVGAGTFLPVKSDRMEDHIMHSEQVRVPLSTVRALRDQLGKAPIVPVGTTAMRTIESLYWHGVMLLQGRADEHLRVTQWEPYEHPPDELPTPFDALTAVLDVAAGNEHAVTGSTTLMIAPGYTFRLADALITNFHQPQSTLLLLVAAFIGPGWGEVYEHALANDYRFLSYGDGSLLFRATA